MRIVRTVAELRDALRPARRAERVVGLVPTMGALHDGHLSLIRRARETCDEVVVSLFVNPSQFNDPDDLAAYPRDEARDAALAADLGADLLFAPDVSEVYPPGFATTVHVAGLTEPLEGKHRGVEHFDAVATVVTKLLNMVGPDVAFFGQKDAQQALVVRKLVRDLDLPVRIEVCPTVREPDGLALSSRNVHLHGTDRERALALHDALRAAEASLAAGERDATALRTAALAAMRGRGVEPEYLELVSTVDLAPIARVDGDVLLAVAARVGTTRLIDNTILEVRPAGHVPIAGDADGRPARTQDEAFAGGKGESEDAARRRTARRQSVQDRPDEPPSPNGSEP
jgi:pantoate--beta-alanine ligase